MLKWIHSFGVPKNVRFYLSRLKIIDTFDMHTLIIVMMLEEHQIKRYEVRNWQKIHEYFLHIERFVHDPVSHS